VAGGWGGGGGRRRRGLAEPPHLHLRIFHPRQPDPGVLLKGHKKYKKRKNPCVFLQFLCFLHLKGPRGPLKGPRGPLKGPRGPLKGPRGPLKRTPGSPGKPSSIGRSGFAVFFNRPHRVGKKWWPSNPSGSDGVANLLHKDIA